MAVRRATNKKQSSVSATKLLLLAIPPVVLMVVLAVILIRRAGSVSSLVDLRAPSDSNQRLVYNSLTKSISTKNPLNGDAMYTEFQVIKWYKARPVKGGATTRKLVTPPLEFGSRISMADGRIAVQADYKLKGNDDVWSPLTRALYLIENGQLVDKAEAWEIRFRGESAEAFLKRTGFEVRDDMDESTDANTEFNSFLNPQNPNFSPDAPKRSRKGSLQK